MGKPVIGMKKNEKKRNRGAGRERGARVKIL